MKKSVLVILLVIQPLMADEMSWSKVDDYCKNSDLGNAQKYLGSFKNSANMDIVLAEIVIQILQSSQGSVQLTGDSKGAKFKLEGKNGEGAGYISYRRHNDEVAYRTALEKLTKLIEKNPDRIDARMYLINALKEDEAYAQMAKAAVAALEWDSKNGSAWKSRYGKTAESLDLTLVNNLQSVMSELFSKESHEADKAFEQISQSMITNRPRHVYGYNNLAGYYLSKKEYDQAQIQLEKAVEVAPTDETVKMNLAFTYEKRGNSEKAREAYKALIRSGSPGAQDWAQKRLKKLK